MCILVQEPDTSPLIAEDIQSQANRVCEQIQQMAASVIALSFGEATSAEVIGSRNSAHSARLGAEFAIDVFRSLAEEALTGQVRRLGYADAMSLEKAWTARLDRNAAARRAAALAKAVIPAPANRPTSATRPSADAPFFGYTSAAGA